MRLISRRRGFTLVELLIIIVVIGVLAEMMIFSSTEAVTTAKAAKILANLQTLKRAATQWYLDNREKVQADGRVTIMVNPNKAASDGENTKPVQEWGDRIQLSKYISSMNDSGIKFYKTSAKDEVTNKQNTNLVEGYYGICDGGTINGYHRNAWYVGYRFKSGEERVRDKIRGRMESSGVFLGTADAHEDMHNDRSAAVWMRVL